MATHCQMGKKGGGQLQPESLITGKICLFSPYFVKYMVFIVWKALKNQFGSLL